MLIQNTNPLAVAPDQDKVRRGFARDDLFVCVHEQFLTDTARYADIVLPATMFLEHDDLYTGGGHQYLQFGPKTIEPPEGCRSNHEVIVALAERLGARHPGFAMSPREIIDWTLRASGRGSLAELEEAQLARLPAAVRGGAFSRRLRLSRRQVPLSRRLGLDALFRRRPQGALARNADPARPLAGQRGGRRGASVQARDFAGAQFSQFELHRDAHLARARSSGRPR